MYRTLILCHAEQFRSRSFLEWHVVYPQEKLIKKDGPQSKLHNYDTYSLYSRWVEKILRDPEM